MKVIPFENSIASIDHARKAWSDKNVDIDGNLILPESIYKKTKKKYFFDCSKCKHTFDKRPASICIKGWCRYCAHLDLCDNLDCTFCFENSFSSNPLKQYIHEDCQVNLRKIFKAGDCLLKFRCHKCTHVFEKIASGVHAGNWCPYCPKTSKILCADLNCQMCMKNSFASSSKARFWSPKNKLKPRDVTISQPHKKYLFDCPKCINEFWKSPNDITKGGWCPFCRNKSEGKLYEALKECAKESEESENSDTSSEYKEFKKSLSSLEYQFYADWCRNIKTKSMLPFDFAIHDLKIIIELDGDQHFEEVAIWKNNPEEQFRRDLYKMAIANRNGYSVIRIYQPDVYSNKIKWIDRIILAIKDIIRTKPVLDQGGSLPTYFIASDLSIYHRFLEA